MIAEKVGKTKADATATLPCQLFLLFKACFFFALLLWTAVHPIAIKIGQPALDVRQCACLDTSCRLLLIIHNLRITAKFLVWPGAEPKWHEERQTKENSYGAEKTCVFQIFLFISDISFLLTTGHIQCLKCDPKNNTSLNLVTRKTLTFENYKKWLQQFGLGIIRCDVKVRLSRLPELF